MEFPALAELDRSLLERCVSHKRRGWEDFVDRFLGLMLHVVDHAAQVRGIRLAARDREAVAEAVLGSLAEDDFRVLRRFRGNSSLATFLTVVGRRLAVRFLLERIAGRSTCRSEGGEVADPSSGRTAPSLASRASAAHHDFQWKHQGPSPPHFDRPPD